MRIELLAHEIAVGQKLAEIEVPDFARLRLIQLVDFIFDERVCDFSERHRVRARNETARRNGEDDDFGIGAYRVERREKVSYAKGDIRRLAVVVEVISADAESRHQRLVGRQQFAHVENSPEKMLDPVAANASVHGREILGHIFEKSAAPVVGQGVTKENDGVLGRFLVVFLYLMMPFIVFAQRIWDHYGRNILILADVLDCKVLDVAVVSAVQNKGQFAVFGNFDLEVARCLRKSASRRE